MKPFGLVPDAIDQQRRKRNGDQSEALWTACHDACSMMGIARVHKIPTPTAGRNGALRYVRRATVDYIGWMSHGRAIVAEAKSRKDGVLTTSDFEDHQLRMLEHGLRDHAVTLLLAVAGKTMRAIPWSDARIVLDGQRIVIAEMGWPVYSGEPYLRRWL